MQMDLIQPGFPVWLEPLTRVEQYVLKFRGYLLKILQRVRRGIRYRELYVRKRKYDTREMLFDDDRTRRRRFASMTANPMQHFINNFL